LMGPGPWTLRMSLTIPSAHGMLHFSNKNKRAPIEIAHTLKIIVRVQRCDERELDLQTGKPKKYDIVMRTPVHVLSVRPSFPRTCFIVLTLQLYLLSPCQTHSIPLSRATPRASVLHTQRRQHQAFLPKTARAVETRVARLYYRIRLRLVVSVPSRCPKGGHPKSTRCTSVI
jgi:hypothetical protein